MSTARALLETLRRHYLPDGRPPGGIFAPEVTDPGGSRRADALWMPTTHAGGRELVGHELKVTRSDVLTELADPTKADAWAKYCTRWWLVVLSPALIDGLEDRLPDHWGVLAPPSGRRTRSMTVVRPAPKLTPLDPAPAYRRLAAWVFYRDAERLNEIERDKRYAEQARDRLAEEVRQLRTQGLARTDPRTARLAAILETVDARAGTGLGWIPDEERDQLVIDAVLDHAAVRTAAERARWELSELVRGARKAAEPMKETARMLAALPTPEVMAR